jgi:RNA polymerase sigma-70 factor (ECF subfamily)
MNELDQQLRELIPRLRRFAVSLTRNSSSADDLVQACLERALSSWGAKRADGDLRAWLFAILYRQFLDAHRRSRRYARMLEFFTGREDAEPSVERTVIAQSTLQAFDRLPTEQRALLLMVSVEGLTYKEVAEILGAPIGTVMSRLSRARQALRQLSDGEISSPATPTGVCWKPGWPVIRNTLRKYAPGSRMPSNCARRLAVPCSYRPIRRLTR